MRPDAGRDQVLAQPALVRARDGDVRHLDRLERDRCAPQHAFPLPDRRGAPGLGERRSLVGRGPLHELLGALVVLEDHAPVEPRDLDGAGDDGRQDGLEIQRGADRPPHLAERSELIDRAQQLGRPRLQLGEQTRVLDGDHRLVREGLQELRSALR